MFGEKSSNYDKNLNQHLQTEILKFYLNCQLPSNEFMEFLQKRYDEEVNVSNETLTELAKNNIIKNFAINHSFTKKCLALKQCNLYPPRNKGEEYAMIELQTKFQNFRRISIHGGKRLNEEIYAQFRQYCAKEKDFISIKLIRVNEMGCSMVKFLEEDPKNLRILYVFRDPRAVLRSALGAKATVRRRQKLEVTNYTKFLASRYQNAVDFYDKYHSKFQILLIRYEDLVMKTAETINKIYHQLNLPLENLDRVTEIISEKTGQKPSSSLDNSALDAKKYGTGARNGTKFLVKYLDAFEFEGMKNVQKVFGQELLEKLGYHFFTDQEQFEKFQNTENLNLKDYFSGFLF